MSEDATLPSVVKEEGREKKAKQTGQKRETVGKEFSDIDNRSCAL